MKFFSGPQSQVAFCVFSLAICKPACSSLIFTQMFIFLKIRATYLFFYSEYGKFNYLKPVWYDSVKRLPLALSQYHSP